MLVGNSRSDSTIFRRSPSYVWHDATMPIVTVTFWCIETVPADTPRIGASRSPVVRPISHQPSCQARTPRWSQASRNSPTLARALRGIAPSEWLTR